MNCWQIIVIQYLLRIQMQQHKKVSFKVPLERSYNSIMIEQVLRQHKNTMIILLIDNDLEIESLITFARDLCKNDGIESGVKNSQRKINFSSQIDFNYFTNSNEDSQIICMDISWMQDTNNFDKNADKISKYADLFYYLFLINNSLNICQKQQNAKVSIYLALQQKNKAQKTAEKLKKFHQILGSFDYGTIYCNYKKQNAQSVELNEIYINMQNKSVNKDEVSLKQIFKYTKNNNLDTIFSFKFINEKQQSQLLRIFQKKKDEAEDIILQFLNPVKHIRQRIFLKKFYDDIFSDVRQILCESRTKCQKNFKIQSQLKQQSDKSKKQYEIKLAYLTFVAKFIKLYAQFVQKFKISGQSYENASQFFSQYYTDLKNINAIQKQDLSSSMKLIIIIFKQIQALKNLSIKKDKQYLNQNIIDKTKKFIPTKSQLFSMILEMKIQKNASFNYYDQLTDLIQCQLLVGDFGSVAEYQLFQFLKIKYEILFRATKSEKYLNFYLGKDDNKIAQAIKDQLFAYKQNKVLIQEEKRINFSDIKQIRLKKMLQNTKHVMSINLHSILKTSARFLRYINKHHLALCIYKKLKYIYQLQQCLRQMLQDLQDNKKISLFVQMSKYFDSIGQNLMGKKYIQLAYQMDSSNLPELVINKTNYLTGKNSNDKQIKTLNNFSKDNNPQSYYNLQLPKQFWAQIQNIQGSIPKKMEADLEVSVSRLYLHQKLGLLNIYDSVDSV